MDERPLIILYPGYIYSRSDNDRHYIDAKTLADLYGIKLSDCIIYDVEHPEKMKGYHVGKDDIHLTPKNSGNYTLPSDVREKLKQWYKIR